MDAARHLLEPPGDAPEAQKTTRLDRKMPQPESRHPGLFESSQATVLELWASPDLLNPPDTSLAAARPLLEPPGDETTRSHKNGGIKVRQKCYRVSSEQIEGIRKAYHPILHIKLHLCAEADFSELPQASRCLPPKVENRARFCQFPKSRPRAGFYENTISELLIEHCSESNRYMLY